MYDYEDYADYYEPSPVDELVSEFRDKCREFILPDVKAEIDRINKENAELKAKNKELRETSGELHRKLRESNQSIDKALKEKEHEVLQKYCAGFAPHDVVYRIDSKQSTTKCEKCNGKGKVPVEVLGVMKEVSCPHCSYGNIYKYNYSPRKDTVSSVYFNIYRADRYNKNSGAAMGEIKVYLDDYDNDLKADQLYKTFEECQIICDAKNKEQESKVNKK